MSLHANVQTIKGVSFFGPASEFVLQGCDTGAVFLYDAYTGQPVSCWPADIEGGAINVVAPHPDPSQPLLLTSGLSEDVLLWRFHGHSAGLVRSPDESVEESEGEDSSGEEEEEEEED